MRPLRRKLRIRPIIVAIQRDIVVRLAVRQQALPLKQLHKRVIFNGEQRLAAVNRVKRGGRLFAVVGIQHRERIQQLLGTRGSRIILKADDISVKNAAKRIRIGFMAHLREKTVYFQSGFGYYSPSRLNRAVQYNQYTTV